MNLVRSFFRDSAVYGVSGIISRITGVLALPVLTKYISPGDYGRLDMITVFGAVVGVLVALEITQAVARMFAEARDISKRIDYASTSLWFSFFGYSLFLILSLLFPQVIAYHLFDDGTQISLVRWGATMIWSYGLFYFLQNQLRWDFQARSYAFSGVVQVIVGVGASIWFVVFLGCGVLGYVWGQMAGYLIGSFIAFFFARHLYHIQFDRRCLREMLHFSAPLVPAALGSIVALYIDRVAIKELMTLSDVGIYGMAYRFASVAGLLIMGFQMAITPLVYQHHDEPDTPLQLANIFRYFLVIVLPVLAFVILFSNDIIGMFTAVNYHSAASVLPMLFFAVLLSNMYVFVPGLWIARKTKNIALLTVLAAVLNSYLNLLMIPMLGIVGAALATLTSTFLVFIGWAMFSQSYYPIPFEWKKYILAVLICVVLGKTGILFAIYLSPIVALLWKVIVLFTVVGAFVLIDLLHKDELKYVNLKNVWNQRNY